MKHYGVKKGGEDSDPKHVELVIYFNFLLHLTWKFYHSQFLITLDFINSG